MYGTGDKSLYIPIYTLAENLCEDISNTILKICVLTRCNATSKAGTKADALKANYRLLASLGQKRPIFGAIFLN